MKFMDILNFYKSKINSAITSSTPTDPLYGFSISYTIKEFNDFNRSIYLALKEGSLDETVLTGSIKFTYLKLLVVIKCKSNSTSEYERFVNACQKVSEILMNERYNDTEDKLSNIHSNKVDINIVDREPYLVCELLLTLS